MTKEVEKEQSDKATFTFARANPPTIGHAKLIQAVKDHATHTGADHHVFLSHTQDAKKNPLSHSQKVKFLHDMVPGTNIHTEKEIKTPIDALKHLHKKGYKHVTMMVGGDREKDMSNLVHKYNGSEYKFDHLAVKSAGERDPDAEGVEGMSASKMRDNAAKKDFEGFKKGVIKKEHAKELYKAVRKGMKLESNQCLFLVGGPGSGKDFILRTVLKESEAREIPLGSAIPGGNIPLIINGNADDYSEVVLEAAQLVEQGYMVSMVFVYTDNEDSKARNEARIRKGEKTISEATRAGKYNESIANLHKFKQAFGEGFFLFDNSRDFTLAESTHQDQVVAWLNELAESLDKYYRPMSTTPKAPGPKEPHPVPAGYERIKDGSFWKLRKKITENKLRVDKKHEKHVDPVGPGDPKGVNCPNCDGTGVDGTDDCVDCNGTGIAAPNDIDANPGKTDATNESVNDLFEKTYPTIVDMIAKKEGKKEGNKHEGGIAVAGAKANTREVVEVTNADGITYDEWVNPKKEADKKKKLLPNYYKKTVKEAKDQEVSVPQSQAPGIKYSKKSPAKSAKAPGAPYDSRLGAVPSVSFGVNGPNESTQPKSFNKLRNKS